MYYDNKDNLKCIFLFFERNAKNDLDDNDNFT